MRKLKALVIDDSRVMRMMIMKTLHQTQLAEFEFVEAADGVEGLARLDAHRPDIAFVDWKMPRMAGIDFVRRARGQKGHGQLPLVVVTSEKSMGKVLPAVDQAGASGCVSKPFTVEEMNRKLAPILDRMAERADCRLR